MGAEFELVKYDMDKYLVFYIDPKLKDSRDERSYYIGFAVIELRDGFVKCSNCLGETKSMQTWWHKKLPFSYVVGEHKRPNVHLCLKCAHDINNQSIIKIKNNFASSKDEQEHSSVEQLLNQYEMENEQIEYYRIYKEQEKSKKAVAS